ncbi:MAG: carbohydrate ABC transporter permease [Chloroflexi bacterium]|nr:carbohydrate ABC transporter permease [Chloroflexota bacterium]MCY4247468.1 carbohydrate ABC transporter permease [Chloroflexota bacterium]
MSFASQQRLSISLRYALLILISLIFIFPIVFMVMSSLKPDLQLLRDSASLRAFMPVGDISLNNYADAFARVPIVQFFFNSVFTTAVSVAAALWLNSMAAFSLAFLQWRGKALVLSLIIATFIVPFEVIAIPLLMVVNNLPWLGPEGFEIGWLNTYHVQIIPFIADSLGIFLFYQYFRDLPDELVEAARIDGASIWQIYARIIMPIAGPILATVAILKFLAMWNAYIWPLMTIRSEELRPIMVGLQYFFQLNTAWGEIMAYLTVVTIPVLLFYLALQRAFIESIATSGIKG